MMETPPAADPEGFVQRETRLMRPPHVPEVALHLADEAVALWQRTEDELGTLGLPPPFWAFAWAGGQALARYILDNQNIVKGRKVLDFASGSGLVAISAALSGASVVSAADIDPFAAAAIRLNARANSVEITILDSDIVGTDPEADVILAGDICYQRDIADRVFAWLKRQNQRGATVLIGDPGRSYLPVSELEAVAEYDIPVSRALEDSEIKRSSVWRIRSPDIAAPDTTG